MKPGSLVRLNRHHTCAPLYEEKNYDPLHLENSWLTVDHPVLVLDCQTASHGRFSIFIMTETCSGWTNSHYFEEIT